MIERIKMVSVYEDMPPATGDEQSVRNISVNVFVTDGVNIGTARYNYTLRSWSISNLYPNIIGERITHWANPEIEEYTTFDTRPFIKL